MRFVFETDKFRVEFEVNPAMVLALIQVATWISNYLG